MTESALIKRLQKKFRHLRVAADSVLAGFNRMKHSRSHHARMPLRVRYGLGALIPLGGLLSADNKDHDQKLKGDDAFIRDHAAAVVRDGRNIFRFDTFGSEAFWGGALRLHQTIAGAANGGTGPGLTPRQTLSLGLKVDVSALPHAVRRGAVNLDDPATTLALLKLDAVVGVKGAFDQDGKIASVGIQCALCHSTVDQSFSTSIIPPGNIGNRLDGWPNRDLNVGAIIASAPTVKPFADLLSVDEATVRQVLMSWGPGKFDAELILDGKAFRPDGKPAATLLPPAFGLAGISQHTYRLGWRVSLERSRCQPGDGRERHILGSPFKRCCQIPDCSESRIRKSQVTERFDYLETCSAASVPTGDSRSTTQPQPFRRAHTQRRGTIQRQSSLRNMPCSALVH